MLSVIKSKRFLMSLLLSVFSFCVSILYNMSALFELDLENFNAVLQDILNQLVPLIIISGIFVVMITFLSYYFGNILQEKINKENKKVDKIGIIIIIISGIIIPILIGLLDYFLAFPETQNFVSLGFTILNTTVSIFYNGFIEEIWLRYFLLSLMIYTFYYVFSKKSRKKNFEDSKNKWYLIGWIFISLLIFLFQLNTIFTTYFYTNIMFLRAFLLYFLTNLSYGWLYIKYNLKMSILTHVMFIIVHLGIVPYVIYLLG